MENVEIIDGTQFGPIYDASTDGDWMPVDELSKLLQFLYQAHGDSLQKRTKVKVLYSYISYQLEDLRYSKSVTRTFGCLLRLFKEYTGDEFNLERFNEKQELKLELFRKEFWFQGPWNLFS